MASEADGSLAQRLREVVPKTAAKLVRQLPEAQITAISVSHSSIQPANLVFYLFADPHGAGKSTFNQALALQRTLAASAEFVNADWYEAAHLPPIADPEARFQAARHQADARVPYVRVLPSHQPG